MSIGTQISTIDNNLKDTINENFFIENILCCKCGYYHEFCVDFQKDYFIIFPCISIKLIELQSSKNFRKKCHFCKSIISIETDYLKQKKNKTIFICENCYKNECKKKDSKYNNLKNISSIIFDENGNDEIIKKIKNKFDDFIDENDDDNEFYKQNKTNIELLKNFIIYLCYLRKLYDEENKVYEIITNFLNYFEYLIDTASKNKQLYDIYHFNKEAIIYSYSIEKNEMFLSSKFKSQYRYLLKKCKKKDIFHLRC